MKSYEETNAIIEEDIERSSDAYRMSDGLPLQCRQCQYWIKNDTFHCEKYKRFKKPKSVIWSQKKCPKFLETGYMGYRL